MKIALVEDSQQEAHQLTNMIRRYFRENREGEPCEIVHFGDAISFLQHFNDSFSVVFMDIQMPNMDGMRAAAYMREKDPQMPLVFVTMMGQYAVRGYDVNAVGFILKPVQYDDFYLTMRRAMTQADELEGRVITVVSRDGMQRLKTRDVYYIEVMRHMLTYHTRKGEISATGNLGDIREQFGSEFIECSRSFLVNPRHIQNISGLDMLMTNGDSIRISRAKKADFMLAFGRWLGEGNGTS